MRVTWTEHVRRVFRRGPERLQAGSSSSEGQLTFEQVLDAELEELRGGDEPRYSGQIPIPGAPAPRSLNTYAKAHWHRLVGLAFSGGGIRSATFNLGVLQALARYGLLQSFDYLSTVSGGGYIGAWLSAWINREACSAVVRERGRELVDTQLRKGGITVVENALAGKDEPEVHGWLSRWRQRQSPRAAPAGKDKPEVHGWLSRWRQRQGPRAAPAGKDKPEVHGWLSRWRQRQGPRTVDKEIAAEGLAAIERELNLQSESREVGEWLLDWIDKEGLDALNKELDAERKKSADEEPEISLGEWLSRQATAKGAGRVESKLDREIPRLEKTDEIGPDREWSPITFLRRFSNYLTPRLGLLGIDTWTAIATYLRNLLLNLTILILTLAVLLLLPRLFVWQAFYLSDGTASLYSLALAVVMVAVTLLVTTQRLERQSRIGRSRQSRLPRSGRSATAGGSGKSLADRLRTGSVVVPLVVAAIAVGLWVPTGDPPQLSFGGRYGGWMAFSALLYLLAWAPALGLMTLAPSGGRGDRSRTGRAVGVGASAVVAGAVGGAALGWMATGFDESGPAEQIEIAIWAPPAVLLIFVIMSAVQVGLMGRAFYEQHRQWWNRVSGWLMLVGLVWAGLFALVFFGPVVLDWLGEEFRPYLSLGWLAATAAGIWAGRSPITGGRRPSRRWLESIVVVAPYLFIVGLAVVIASSTQELAEEFIERPREEVASETIDAEPGLGASWREEGERIEQTLEQNGLTFLLVALVLALVAVLISARLDVNAFSMHNFYRNRLIRAYLGASRVMQRNPEPFTGFDPKDDFPLSRLQGQLPLHIFNTTLTLTAGQELAWQERKAASFFFTPRHFGFNPGKFNSRAAERGFRAVPIGHPGFTLGTAMAISGAAVNPNMGQHSSPALAFLMTIFNTRLGWWLRNPNRKDWRKDGPRHAIDLLLRELRGSGSADSRYVNLSDGGFFDNTGIYELVRRRCRFILACDAESDPGYRFSALGNVIRRCRSDFGVDIEIQLDSIRPPSEGGFSRWHCAVGTIYYDTDDSAPNGTLVYLKASLTGDEPEDLLNYARRHERFPHEPTADQWFGEAQFESYRTLGFHAAQVLLEAAGRSQVDRQVDSLEAVNIESVFVDLRRAWYPPSSATARSFTRHTERLVEIFDRLRRNRDLRFLDRTLYLDLEAWKTTGGRSLGMPPKGSRAQSDEESLSEDEVRSGFYLCSSMIQLMENVYLDLELGRESGHPDNRGWMNLFRHWASSATFRRTWAVSAATYGARFQTFCRRQLLLDVGTVWVDSFEIPGSLERVEGMDRLLEGLGGLVDRTAELLEAAESMAADDCLQARNRLRAALRLALGLDELNTIERDLFLATYRQTPAPDTLCLVNMSVLTRASVRRSTRDPAERGDCEHEPGGAEMTFPIGFALLALERLQEPKTGKQVEERTLRYFRVRNHLRRLGLGRQAMRCLVNLKPPVALDHLLRDNFTPGRRQQTKNLFRSVLNESDPRRPSPSRTPSRRRT